MIAERFSPPWIALILWLLQACSSTPKEPEAAWVEDQLSAPSGEFLWKVTRFTLERQEFPLATGLDPAALVLKTAWRQELAPFRGQGYRVKAEVRFEPVAAQRWRVRVRVQRQTNEALAQPLDPAHAQWEWASEDTMRAAILLEHIKSYCRSSIELSPPAADPLEERPDASQGSATRGSQPR